MASEEVRGSFCRDDSCVITDQLATGPGALERELLLSYSSLRAEQAVSAPNSRVGWAWPTFFRTWFERWAMPTL